MNLPDTHLRERKLAIRREIRERLKALDERGSHSESICETIVANPVWGSSKTVAIFAPMQREPDVELLWRHAAGKTLCYPVVRAEGMEFVRVDGPSSLIIGSFGIREPEYDPTRVIPPDAFDLVLVPGAAFTVEGGRLGRGGGFYDRLLSSPGFRAFKLGVCFDQQILADLPLEPHDQSVHRVVTESGWG